MMKIKQEDGFTFIENIAIMLIIGSLAAVAVSMFFWFLRAGQGKGNIHSNGRA